MSTEPSDNPTRWFPFTATEVEVAFGLYGFFATALAFAGVDSRFLAAAAGAYVVLAYLAGLLVYARRSDASFRFLAEGALRGQGYVQVLRRARRSVLLIHVDDGAPSENLLGLRYSWLLPM